MTTCGITSNPSGERFIVQRPLLVDLIQLCGGGGGGGGIYVRVNV